MPTTSPQDAAQTSVPTDRETDAEIRGAVAALASEWHDEAILSCERALKADPECAEAIFLLGLVNFDLDEPIKAIELLEKAHALNPHLQEFAEALAAVQVRVGKVNDALFFAKLATTLAPHPRIANLLPERFGTFFKNIRTSSPQIYVIRAQRSFESGKFTEAAEHCRRQLELTPGDTPTLRLLGQASLESGQFDTAVSAFHSVVHAGPPEASDLAGLGSALSSSGRVDEAAACRAAALNLAPDDAALHSGILADLVRRPGLGRAQIEAAQKDWRDRHAAAIVPRTLKATGQRDSKRSLRVAYLSGSFHGNDFIELFEPVLQIHARGQIEAYCYSDGKHIDTATESLKSAAAKWTDTTGIDDETTWQILRGDEIDIAVDLSGHFKGGRPLLFARRPAPVTVSWLGYPYPPGIAGLDYFLTDGAAWPAPADGADSTQKVWCLPRAPFAYLGSATIPPVGPLPAGQSGRITLGVSCDLGLLTPSLVCDWAQMLWCHDAATLLVCNRFDQDKASIQRVHDLFSHFGLRQRVDVVNMADNFRSGFMFYDHVDIALDTGSCDSLVENCRALWMGVPVVGIAGEHHAARLGASLVKAAGRPDWAVRTPQALTAVVAELVEDIVKLAELRAKLRDEAAASPLGDPVGLTAALEQAYSEMWQRSLAT